MQFQRNSIDSTNHNSHTQIKKIDKFSYDINAPIGQGYSSQVFKGKNTSNNTLTAIKVINMHSLKDPIHLQLLSSEIDNLKILANGHPNIMHLIDVFRSTNNTYIITEFCNQGDLA